MVKLKVYRTPAGFHDAYVAAPSQKAALAAWGSEANLFARGMAEVVSDPVLMQAPLAHPGEVIRVARTMADAPDPPAAAKGASRGKTAGPLRKPAPAPKPRRKPSRAALDKAEAAIEEAEARYAEERAQLKREEEALAARRRALEKAAAAARTKLDRARIRARDAYEAALEEWRAD